MKNCDARITLAKHHGFFPVMLFFERFLGDRATVGGNATLFEEGVRFRHDPSLAFSCSDLRSIEKKTLPSDSEDFTSKARELYEITTTFLGLIGAVSPLPHYFSEEILQHEPESTRQSEFLDIFHHRLISLFYRARIKYDYPDTYLSDESDLWSRRVLSFLGFEPEERPTGPRLPAWRILRLAPLLSERHLTASALEVAIADGLQLGEDRVAVEQFVGTWVPVEVHQRTRLGVANHELGRDLLLGRRIFDRATKFDLVLGPLNREEYERLYGGGESVDLIHATIATLIADPFEYDVILWLSENVAAPFELSRSGAFRLGRNSWLGGQSRKARVRLATHRPHSEQTCEPTQLAADGSLF